jgi:predicted DNA binding CopG/RHH family protein
MGRNGGDMKNNSDKTYEKFKDYDFADAKTVAKTPHLAKLQAAAGKKTRITMRVDSNVLAVFKTRAEIAGGSYQTLMNEALKQFAHGLNLADVVRTAVREALDKHPDKSSSGRGKKCRAA